MNDVTQDLRRLAGQLIMIRFPGTVLDDATAAFLREHQVRGVCLFRQNMRDAAQLSTLTADLRAAMGQDAQIDIDQEGGADVRATRVPAAP
jgi:beta-N-acetylhexosaminidase